MATALKKIAVIGAGPCGSIAAMALDKSIFEVTLFDKKIFPRNKVCGDALGIDAIQAIHSYNEKLIDDLIQSGTVQQINSFKIFDNKSELCTVDFMKQKIASFNGFYPFVCKRFAFDNFLVEKALGKNVNFVNAHVTNIEKTLNGKFYIELNSSEKCDFDFILIANGSDILAKRFLNFSQERIQYYGVRQYIKADLPNANSMYFILPESRLPVYFWAFPVAENTFNVGIYFREKSNVVASVTRQKEDLLLGIESLHYLRKVFGDYKVLSKPEAYNIPYCKNIQSNIAGNDFLIAGAAAGLVDPLTGEGISYAIKSGLIAAEVFNKVKGDKLSRILQRDYFRAIDTQLGNKARQSFYLQTIFSSMLMCRLAFFFLKYFPFSSIFLNKLRRIRKIFRGNFKLG